MRIFSILSLLILLFICVSCSVNERNEKVTLTIQGTFSNNKVAEIKMWDILRVSNSTLAMTEIDSSGTGVLEFTIDKPTFATLKLADRSSNMYLEPGYNLSFQIDENPDNPIVFSGYGSEPNNYLEKYAQLQYDIENVDGKNLTDLNEQEFLERIDTLENTLIRFHHHYCDSVELPDNLTTLFEKRNTIIPLFRTQVYGWNYGARNNFDIPESLDVSNIPYYSSLLETNMVEYAIIWQIYMLQKYYLSLPEGETNEDRERIIQEAPLIVLDSIIKDNYPPYFNEFLLAKNVDYWMSSIGISQSVDSIYHLFKTSYPNSFALASLENQYKEWKQLSAGEPAPDFSGITLEGNKLSLSDLRGKVVYVDVWATWCGPCKAEIPHSIELQDRFKKTDPIVFVNVSVDKKQEAWKKMVFSNHNWKGIHLIEQEAVEYVGIMSSYKIQGIPRYILIDSNGKIVNVDAPRPSSGDLIFQQIQSLLNIG